MARVEYVNDKGIIKGALLEFRGCPGSLGKVGVQFLKLIKDLWYCMWIRGVGHCLGVVLYLG